MLLPEFFSNILPHFKAEFLVFIFLPAYFFDYGDKSLLIALMPVFIIIPGNLPIFMGEHEEGREDQVFIKA